MNISPGSYPDFNSESTLEELVLNMGRRFLELQKNLNINQTGFDYINLTTDEEAETYTLNLENVPASVEAGVLTVAAPAFTSPPAFAVADGAVYPWNRPHLLDALTHLLIWQSRLEISRATNSDEDAVYVEVSIGSEAYGAASPLLVSIDVSAAPLIVELYAPSRGRPYLGL